VSEAASHIWNVHDAKLDDSEQVKAAQKLIKEAAVIWFMGFHFDEENYARLGVPNDIKVSTTGHAMRGSQLLLPNMFGEDDVEIERIHALLPTNIWSWGSKLSNLPFLRAAWARFTSSDEGRAWGRKVK
jgi:hypothetical protein